MKRLHHQFWLTSTISLLCLVGTTPVQAQITPDGTLGAESSVVTPNVFINGRFSDRISGGAIRGVNLFHSFREFNVATGRGAYFTNPTGVENILSRVTGTNPSNILGTLGVSGNANLFLINPNGIIFGPNSRLDVANSFVASTASGVNFADGTQFSVTNSETRPLLTVSVPIGLQFGATVGDIQVQGATLSVRPGNTLALVGGDIALAGGVLTAPTGRIELGSVAGGSLVTLTPRDGGLALGYEGVSAFQDIELSELALVGSSDASGDIQVQGRRVTVREGSQIVTSALRAGVGGTLLVRAAESVELLGTSSGFPSGLFAITPTGPTGGGGSLTVETGQLLIRDGAQASVSTLGEGSAGDLTVRAVGVELVGTSATGSPSGLFATARNGATGVGGNLTVEAERLSVREGAQVSVTTLGQGDAGDLTVRATDVELMGTASVVSATGLPIASGLFAGTEVGTTGDGGDLTIETSRLVVEGGAEAQVSTLGDGDAGNLTVRAAESVKLSGRTADGEFPSGLLAVSGLEGVTTEARGRGGDLRVETGELMVRDGAEITVGSANPSGEAQGAGRLEIQARSIYLDNQAAIAAQTASGDGGNITLQVQDLLLLRHNSNISTTAGTALAGGNGGNMTIDAPFIVAVPLEDSNITANAFTGNGGNIQITAQAILGLQFRENETPLSDITASSQFGVDGEVQLNTPEVDPSQGLVVLPGELVDATGLIVASCRGAVGQAQSKFIVTGRGGIPPSPSDFLSSNAVLNDWIDLQPMSERVESLPSGTVAMLQLAGDASVQGIQGGDAGVRRSFLGSNNVIAGPLVEAQGWVINHKGEVVLTAEAPTVVPRHVGPMSVSCSSF